MRWRMIDEVESVFCAGWAELEAALRQGLSKAVTLGDHVEVAALRSELHLLAVAEIARVKMAIERHSRYDPLAPPACTGPANAAP